MKESSLTRLSFTCILLSFSACLSAQVMSLSPAKKLIDFGWHSPLTTEYRADMKKYEKPPFDGVTLKLPKSAGAGNVFMIDDLKKIPAGALDSEMQLAGSMPQSRILTDNFLVIYGASQMDWFSDDNWVAAEKYIRYCARLAKAMKCKGILWDPEPYKPGKNPWKYDEQPGAGNRTFEDYWNQIRKRGAQFITALHEEYPGLTVFSLREFSDFQKGSPFSAGLLPVNDINSTIEELKKAWWGLHIPFTVGILEAITDDVTFIDANEDAYYYTSALEFFQIRNTLKADARAFLPPELHRKLTGSYFIGHAISVDYTSGNWAEALSFPYRLKGQADMLTPEEKALWFEHNAYYALRTADEYAWLYTERSNWWTGQDIPAGFAEALVRAKNKVAKMEPLGYSVEKMLEGAREKASRVESERKRK